MYRALTVTLSFLFFACGSEGELPPTVSPFQGTWQYLKGMYQVRCLVEPPADIDLTGKRMGLTIDPHFPSHVQSSYLTHCDITPGTGLIWTIQGTTATVQDICRDFHYDGMLSLSGETLTVNITETDSAMPPRCTTTRQGTLTKLSPDPGKAQP